MIRMSTIQLAQEDKPNFLVPNATFFVETIIFLVVMFIFFRFIVPPIRQALKDRDDMITRQAEESRKASETFAAAEQRHQEALAEARAEANSIRDAARADGQRTLDELRGQANAEVARLRSAGEEQLAAQRSQAMNDLEPHLAELSRSLASRIVGEDVTVASGGRRS
jgi:F-type H+-transporting ATPase subunit b